MRLKPPLRLAACRAFLDGIQSKAFVVILALLTTNWPLSIGVSAFVTTAFAESDRGQTLPPLPGIIATDSLTIAKAERPASGLWITCSEGPQIRLALNTRLPIEEEFARNGTRPEERTHIIILAENIRTVQAIKHAPHMLFRQATWRRDGENDVVLTPPLSVEKASLLSQAFLPAPPAVVRIDIAETGTEMRGTADGRAIAEFTRRCLESP
ncbi:hypothetical protein [Rhizobium laguerreae]|uniref:Uncharacterized protein n=1 Tax=Rhizobium laguerreae TaxID=1076926 RepID=A0A6N9ZK55_9HYPH|nr:hypothetical protein [Rhizobium laguerreae]NEH93696.1 hypothetical protein [Rhizobium laguerreae]